MSIERIRFQGEEYWLIHDGPIAKPESYRDGQCSYAHFYPSEDAVKRFGVVIGTGADIERLGLVPDDEVEVTDDAMGNILFGDWSPPGGEPCA